MNLLDEIRADLVDESARLSNTLRKAKILASELGIPEFQEWLQFELNGYPERGKVPSYRIVPATNLGTFSGPLRSGVKNMPLPTSNLPEPVKDFAENMVFLESVGALEGILAQGSRSSQRRWPQEFVLLSRDTIQMLGGMKLVDVKQPIPPYVISGVLDTVKNKLLDFILGMQKSNVTSEGLNDGTVETTVARNLFNVNIYGDHNVVASGEKIHQRGSPVQKGDINSLVNHFRELNIGGDDLRELEEAVSSERCVPNGELGPKVRAWVGGMISKAASGIGEISIDTAAKVLMDALKRFYGC